MPPHFLTNFEIQEHCQREPKFNGVHSKNDLLKIKDTANVINFNEHKSIELIGYLCMWMVIM